MNDTFITNTYNSNNDILVSIKQVWQSNSWLNSDKKTKTYNTDFLILEILNEDWVSSESDWENDYLYTYSYNEFNNILELTIELWYNGTWDVVENDTYEYDEHQNLIHNEGYWSFEYWDVYYYYSEYDIILANYDNLNQNNYSIIPNPSNDNIIINGINKNVEILFYDINGKRVLEAKTGQNIDISSLRTGMYFVKIVTEDSVTIKKFLKN